MLISLLPTQGKLRLCLARTEWDFGRCQVNILLVTVGRGEFQVLLWVKALAGGDFLFLFASAGLGWLDQLYAKRWTIEQCFRNLKGRGFNLEATHLRCRHKLRKLVALVSLAYACCLGVGLQADQKRQPIARKNHGYPATSYSRHGLNILRQLTRPGTCPHQPLARLVEGLADWLARQLLNFHLPKIVA